MKGLRLLALLSLALVGCSEAFAWPGGLGPRRLMPVAGGGGGTAYQSAMTGLATQPTAWWWMDEASGNLTDHIGSNTATAVGSCTYHATSIVTGETNGISCDGSTANANIFTLASAITLSGDFTIAAWGSSAVLDNTVSILSSSNSNYTALHFNGSNRLYNDVGTLMVYDGTSNTAGRHFYLWRRSSNALTFYKDGANTGASGTDSSTIHPDRLFENPNGGSGTWTLQHVAIWASTAISNADDTTLWNAGK